MPSGPRGRRGAKGLDGKDFNLEENLSAIQNILANEVENKLPELKLKFEDLSDEEKDQLKGKDGKSVKVGEIVPVIIDYIENNRNDFCFEFSDLTQEQLESIRGPQGEKGSRGQRGRQGIAGPAGKDFVLEENLEHIKSILEELKPKLSDFTEEEIENLRGEKGEKGARGQRGKPGRDFIFEDEEENIKGLLLANIDRLKLNYSDLTEEEVDELKLKFESLSDEEKDSLKLKFSDLSEEEIERLRGPKGARGQRGKQGVQGEKGDKGDTGSIGPMGPPGISGIKGIDGNDGRDGQDGKDAPKIIDIEVVEVSKDKIYFVFYFDDGSKIITKTIEIPTNVESYYSFGAGSSGGPGGAGSKWYTDSGAPAAGLGVDGDFYLDSDTGDYYEKIGGVWTLQGNLQGQSAYEIAVDNGFVGTEAEWLDSLKASVSWEYNGTPIGDLGTVNFTGAGVTVTEDPTGVLKVDIPGGGGTACIEVEDEYDPVTNCAKSINFIGDNVTVRPRVFMSEWPTLDDVEPSLSDYEGAGNPENIDVYIDFQDPSIITDVDCDASVYVGSFVRMTGAGVAVNALADSLSNSNVLGVVESKDGSTKCTIRVSGRSADLFVGLDPTKDYFLSETTPGAIQTTVPTNTGEVMLNLGQPFSATSFFYNKGERVERL